MSTSTPRSAVSQQLAALHDAFLSILPGIELHGRIFFRGVGCPHKRDDCVAETVAFAWVWFLRLVERGQDPLGFPGHIAAYAARHVRAGRRVCGQQKGKDVMSAVAQQRHGFLVGALPGSTARPYDDRYGTVHGQRRQDVFEERLCDNTQTPVPEQVCFRLDFPAWLRTLDRRQRGIVGALARNERTRDVSRRFHLSPARISQLRRELHNDWARFCGDATDSGRRHTTRNG